MSTICKRARSIENPSPFSFSWPENFHTQKLLVTKIWCLSFRHAVKKYGPVTFHIMSGNLINVKCNFFFFQQEELPVTRTFCQQMDRSSHKQAVQQTTTDALVQLYNHVIDLPDGPVRQKFLQRVRKFCFFVWGVAQNLVRDWTEEQLPSDENSQIRGVLLL